VPSTDALTLNVVWLYRFAKEEVKCAYQVARACGLAPAFESMC